MTPSKHSVIGSLIVTLLFFLGQAKGAADHSALLIPPIISTLTSSDDFTVEARTPGGNWHSVPVYFTQVAHKVGIRTLSEETSVASFDFSGTVDLRITANKKTIEKLRVRPLSYGIKPDVKGNTLSFSLSQPRNLSIEVNGDIFHNLQLFANAPLPAPPTKPSPHVLLYGPGVHQVGNVTIPSGTTVYLASGALILGHFSISKASHIRVYGHGIILGKGGGFSINSSKDILIDGPLTLFSGAVLIADSDQITVKNIKSLSACTYGDGLDIFCSSHVLLDGLFMRNSDDCIAIYGHRGDYYGNVSGITLKNSTLWADVAHPILVGTHGDSVQPDTLQNLCFCNIDILDHCEAQIDYQGCMSLNAGDSNLIRNVRFENIRVEDFRQGQLLNLRVMFSRKYNTTPGRGIENVLFKNVTYEGTHANPSVIAGYDDCRPIKNLVFENLNINGLLISDTMKQKPAYFKTSDMARFFVGEHVQNLSFRSSQSQKENATNKQTGVMSR